METKNNINSQKTVVTEKIKDWSRKYYVNIFIFNLILLVLVLLYTAGYFSPFFPLTVNLIIMISLVLAMALLGIRSTGVFVISLTFLIFAVVVLYLDVRLWAERTMIYVFESFVLGVVLLFFEKEK